MPSFGITSQYPVVTKTNTDLVVTIEYLRTFGVGPFAIDVGSAVNCTASLESGVDDEIIVSPDQDFYGEADVMIRLRKNTDYSDWFRLRIGVQPYMVPGKGVPVDNDGTMIMESPRREERKIKRSNIVCKNPENMRRGQPFYS